MGVPVQFICFSCFLCFVTGVQGQVFTEITCTAPDIPNGYVDEQVQVYQKDAILKYICLEGFKPREGSPRCAKFGWTLNPKCEVITCVLMSTTIGVEKINPAGKTIFRVGERVEITCTEKYWFRPTKESIKSFICQDDGQWDYNPGCEEIRCEVPRDQHVVWPYYYFRGDMNLGVKKYYRCERGYDQVEAVTTCTRDGWTPKPQCKKMCAAPNITNAQIVGDQRPNYRISSILHYKCNPGFEPDQHVQITCNSQSKWTGIQQCTEKMCAAPNITNAEIVGDQRPNYTISSEIHYKCNTGFEPDQPIQITCNPQTEWTGIRQCTEKCGPPPNVEFADTTELTKNEYNSEERVEYRCFNKYTLLQRHPYSKYYTCEQGEWRGNIKCLKPCTVTVEEMDERGIELRKGGRQKIFPLHEDIITFACQREKKPLNVNALIQYCNDGVMILPECV